MPPPGTGRGAPTRSVGHTHFEAPTMAVPAGGDACGAMGALLDGGAKLFDGAALPAGGTALLCALAGGAGSGLSLPTRGAACASPAEEADDRGVPRSVGGA